MVLLLATDGLWDSDEGAATPDAVSAALCRRRRVSDRSGDWAGRVEAAAAGGGAARRGGGSLAAILAGRAVRLASKYGRPVDDCTVVVVPLG